MANNNENEFGGEPPVDNRMGWIRALEDHAPREYYVEYEFASEVRIAGQLNYHDDNLMVRFLTAEPDRNGLMKYVLSVFAPAEYRRRSTLPSREGYHFDGGYVIEILSLASVYLRCRFFPVSYTFRDVRGRPITKLETDFNYVRANRSSDRNLFDDSERNFVHLIEFLDRVRNLPEKLHHRFANAVRLYALAVKEIGVNDALAYVHLVSSIETIARYHRLTPEQDPLCAEMARIHEAFSDAKSETRRELGNLFAQRKSLQKFVFFILEFSNEAIGARPSGIASRYRIFREDLPDALKRVYNGRSKFLHEGASMYLSLAKISAAWHDYDPSLGQIIDNREFSVGEKLPNIAFFENLVRACLLKYLEVNIGGHSSVVVF